jgi:acetylornithine deacetylase/succinyl-diaminopimelate desuccinylase-like protein
MRDLVERVREVLPSVRRDLEALVRIKSVWADPARRGEVHRSAQATADLLSQAGFDDVQIVSEGGATAVIARHPAPPAAPTVLLYAHHDVQPEGDPGQWTSPPFEPTERDGRLYGRGSADDKAGIATHLAAFRAHGGKPPVGVTVFVEGEEESGSPSLGRLLAAHRDVLAADVIVIADSDNWSTDVPALTVSLRGLADCVVEVATLDHGLHSGLWGGVVPDALSALVRRWPACTTTKATSRWPACTKAQRPQSITLPSGCVRNRAYWTASPKSAPARCRSGCGPSRRSP